MSSKLSRRDFFKLGGLGLLTATGAAALSKPQLTKTDHRSGHLINTPTPMNHGDLPGTGDVDHEKNGFDPMEVLTDFDYGTVSVLPNGQTLHEYKFVAVNKTIGTCPGHRFSGMDIQRPHPRSNHPGGRKATVSASAS